MIIKNGSYLFAKTNRNMQKTTKIFFQFYQSYSFVVIIGSKDPNPTVCSQIFTHSFKVLNIERKSKKEFNVNS